MKIPNCYQKLLDDNLHYYIQAFGDSNAIGLQGPQESISRAYNMICNFDGNYKTPILREIYTNFASVFISRERFRKSLYFYLFSNLLLDEETQKTYSIDEDDMIQDIIFNEESVQKRAEELTDKFMNEELKTHYFMPITDKPSISPFFVSFQKSESEE